MDHLQWVVHYSITIIALAILRQLILVFYLIGPIVSAIFNWSLLLEVIRLIYCFHVAYYLLVSCSYTFLGGDSVCKSRKIAKTPQSKGKSLFVTKTFYLILVYGAPLWTTWRRGGVSSWLSVDPNRSQHSSGNHFSRNFLKTCATKLNASFPGRVNLQNKFL